MKRIDSGTSFDEQHYRVPELAAKWGVSRATIRTLIRNNPDIGVRYLPATTKFVARRCRTPLIPESAARQLYLLLPKNT